MGAGVLLSEELEPGVRYVEEQSRTVCGVPVKDCFLVVDGEYEPISMLDIRTFEQRFGAIAIRMEGIGGVETHPKFRRRGWMSKLLVRALSGVAERVHVAAIGDAIPGVYEKHGFTNCLAERELRVDAHEVAALNEVQADDRRKPRPLVEADLPGIVALYNEAHAQRSWTHRRSRDWNKLVPEATWSPGSTGMVLESYDVIMGYAIFTRPLYGHRKPELRVDEMAARDQASARLLISAIAELSLQAQQSQFTVGEPLDSVVGRTLKALGCSLCETHLRSGGMMARMLHRGPLLRALEPELRRRCQGLEAESLHEAGFAALMAGTLGIDRPTLLSLLVGHWSLAEARTRGLCPSAFSEVLELWFPGGGGHQLPTAHAHRLDRY
jgi:predicted acetyltransferase